MTIPKLQDIRKALLLELYEVNVNHSAITTYFYNKLLDYFDSSLTDEDIMETYQNSKSKWANAIQVVRTKLVNEGLLLKPNEHIRGEWKLSPKGIAESRKLFFKIYNYDKWEKLENPFVNIDTVEKFRERNEDEVFPEGKEKYTLHRSKERNPGLIALKKQTAIEKNPMLNCEICGISFKERYGEIGEGFIEAHHIIPISELTEETESKLEDLILLCSNCHKIIHRKRPCLPVEKIKDLLNSNPLHNSFK